MALDTIADGLVVSLSYVLKVDGEEVDRAERDDPLDYLHGHENIIPGLESALTGKRVGDRLQVTVSPENGYGEYDAEEVEELDRSELPESGTLEPGTLVELEDEDGFVYLATVTEVTSDTVTLDFNPPLAGKTLHYDVEVVAIREATPEELDHGHVHGADFDDYDDNYDYEDEDEE